MSGLTLAMLRGKSREEQIALAAQFAGTEPSVIDGIWNTESARGTNMRSRAGARGHFQIMPREHRVMSQRLGFEINPDNFEHSLLAAAHMLKENLDHFGNLPDALRAYNGGWDRRRWNNEETRAYVGKVLGQQPPREPGINPIPVESVNLETLDVLNTRPADIEAGIDAAKDERPAREYQTTLERRSGFLNAIGGDVLATPAATGVTDAGEQEMARQDTAAVQREIYRDSLSVVDKAAAALDDVTLVGAAIRSIDRLELSEANAFDPNFRYSDHMESLEAGLDYGERQRMREARSHTHAINILGEIKETRTLRDTYGGDSQTEGFLWSLGAGVADPAGWLAGLGVGKVAQVAGVGGRTLAAAGRPVSAAASIIGEGVAGNVLTTAALDAAGEYVSPEEYFASAGFGAIIGAAMSPFTLRSGAVDRAMRDYGNDIIETNQASFTQRLTEAQTRLGPDATPEQIANDLREQDAQRFLREAQVALAPMPDSNRFFNADGHLTSEAPDADAAKPRTLGERIREAFGLGVIPDEVEAQLTGELYAKAEQFTATNPVSRVEEDAALRRFSPVSWMGQDSTGETLIRSSNPLARMFGQVVAESSTGRGGRRQTVAMTQHLRERLYMQRLNEVDAYFRIFRKEMGQGSVSELLTQDARKAFNRAITEELVNRGKDGYVPAPPHIRKAADIYSEGYHRMAIDQQVVGTVGSARITPDTSYFPQRLSSAKVVELTNAQRNAFINAISEQVQARYGWDKEFSDKVFAPQYLKRGIDRATGAYDVPINLNAPDAGDIIDDVLDGMAQKASGKELAQIEEMRGKFSRGGAGHTKGRTDFDILKTYTADDGSTFSLIDIMETDHNLLYRSYARRTAGEVALAQAGVPGAKGLKLIRQALQSGQVEGKRVTPQELAAFDQIAAELLNQPFGQHSGKFLDNTRLLTSMARLGGMALTQFAENGNAIAPLGVHRTFAVIKDLPALMKEVEALRKGEKVDNPILTSLEQGYGGQIGMDDIHTIGTFDVIGNDVQMYGKENIGVATKAIRAGANAHAYVSLHRHMAAAQTRGMAREIGMKAMRFIREGKEDKALADMGFTPELKEAIKRNLDRIAEFNERGVLTKLDIHAGDLTPAQRRDIITAVNRGASQIIQRTYIGETGPWAHNGFLKLLFQFRTFSMAAAEKQMGRNFNLGAAYTFITMMAGFSFGIPVYLARTAAASLGLSEEERDEFLENRLNAFNVGKAGMQYASSFGFLADATDIGLGFTGAWGEATGLAPSEGGGRYGQYSNTLLGGTVMPAAGLVEDVWKGAHGDWRKLAKSMPGANLPYVIPFINALETELED